MSTETPAYGLWGLVLINSVVFILFAYSFFKPQTKRDWRSFGAFSAFLVALFTEMYGFPLTIYLLSGWLQSRFPDIDWFSHDAGHLLEMMFGWKSNPHAGPIGGGFWLIAAAWRVLYDAQLRHELATAGAYSYVRHPQYVGFILIMLGFLAQWPTPLTLAMFPVMVWSCMCGWPTRRNKRFELNLVKSMIDTRRSRQAGFHASVAVAGSARRGCNNRCPSWA
jgi:protein-S-isoprenylcysteine O-methyltransferase Ste14